MFCPNCGNQMNDDAMFCGNCGWSREGKKTSTKGHRGIPIVPILAVIVLLLIVLILKVGILNGSNFENAKLLKSYEDNISIDKVETVKFGSYPQRDASGNKKDAIKWIVLERDEKNRKVLLLSKYILDCKSFYNGNREDMWDEKIKWDNSTLRKWLNDEFYNHAFSSKEQERIQATNTSSDYQNNSNVGNNVNDKIFCLSIEEIQKYFNITNIENESIRLATSGTNYAKNVNNGGDTLYVESANVPGKGNSIYWLRSEGNLFTDSSSVDQNGKIYKDYSFIGCTIYGVRPAIWVKY